MAQLKDLIVNGTTRLIGKLVANEVSITKYSSSINGQVRNIYVSTSDPTGGMSGDIWIKYKG